jgi:hypothetical protein
MSLIGRFGSKCVTTPREPPDIRTLHEPHSDCSARHDVGIGRECFKEAINELLTPAVLVVAFGIANRKHEAVRSLKTAPFVHQALKAAHNKACADKQKESKCDLGGHKRRAQAALAARTRLPVPFTKRGADSLQGRLECGRKAATPVSRVTPKAKRAPKD